MSQTDFNNLRYRGFQLTADAEKTTYVQISPFHLQRYVDEEAFRFNARKVDDGLRFQSVMVTTVGRRLTWRRLCEVDGAGFMGLE